MCRSSVLAVLTGLLVCAGASCAQSPSGATTILPAVKVPDHLLLTGSVKYVSGAFKDSGTITLSAAVDGSTSEAWVMQSGTWGYKATSFLADRTCERVTTDGKLVPDASTACFRIVPWFSAAFVGTLVANATAIKTEATNEEDRANKQQRSTIAHALPDMSATKPKKAAAASRFVTDTSVDILYDSATSLPTKMTFVDKQDSEPSHNVPIEIVYSDYRLEQGIMLPHHIQKFVQRSMQADIQVTNVSFN